VTLATTIGRDLVAVVLVASGAAKLADVRNFQGTLVGLGVHRGTAAAAWLVGGLELAVGVVSLTSLWPRVTDGVVLALTLVFAAVAAVAARRSPGLRCRCFGALSNSQFGRKALLRSLVLAAVAAAVLAGELVDGTAANRSALPLAALVAAAGVFALAAAQAARTIGLVQEGEAV
jgi:uncharacterized membrane protein YphA (DoxX/SURF4 family)